MSRRHVLVQGAEISGTECSLTAFFLYFVFLLLLFLPSLLSTSYRKRCPVARLRQSRLDKPDILIYPQKFDCDTLSDIICSLLIKLDVDTFGTTFKNCLVTTTRFNDDRCNLSSSSLANDNRFITDLHSLLCALTL